MSDEVKKGLEGVVVAESDTAGGELVAAGPLSAGVAVGHGSSSVSSTRVENSVSLMR